MYKKTLTSLQRKLKSSIGNIKEVNEYSKGFLTQNYIIRNDNNSYFLKKHRKESEKKINFIEASEYFFSNNGVKVLLPITINNKKHICLYEDIYVLFPFITSNIISEDQLTDKHIKSIANLLAEMHRIALDKKDIIKLPQIEEMDEVLQSYRSLKKISSIKYQINAKNKQDSFDLLTLKIIKIKEDYLNKYNKSLYEFNLGQKILTHGDFHNNNIFFNNKSEIEWVFDFEKTKIDSYHSEVVRTIMICCFNHQFEERNYKKARLFLRTYTKKNLLDKNILNDAIEFYITKLFYSVWIESEHYLKLNNKMDILYKEVCNSLIYLNKNKEKLVQNITSY